MASNEESLQALTNLMNEFFDGQTSNERKRAIEEILNSFSQQKDAWKHCLYFMSNTHNEYVMMYCMTVIESLINRQWIGFQGEDKADMRNTLTRFLLAQHDSVPVFIRNKLVKLVVDIGRLDWPHFYPDFFSSIIQMIQQPNTAALGLTLLLTTSEELACPREDLSVSRKDELNRLLIAQVPNVLSLLNNMLSSIMEKHRSMVTATPPPSPTHGQSADTHTRSPMSIISSSPPGSLLSNMFKSPQSRVRTESLAPLDCASHQLCVLALNCLSHLFSWIPLSTTITPSLLSTIFHFAAFGCEVTPNQNASCPGSSFSGSGGSQSLGVLAMCCINELLSKNCVPQEFEDFLLQMFQQTFYLLQRITKDSTTSSSGNRLAELDESYVEKFTEFLRLFVSVHLRRFEANNQFQMLDFLTLLFKYTFKQPSNEGYFLCLDIWTFFLDYLSTSLAARSADKELILGKYKEALVSLATQVLQKMQFRFNQSQLDELDDEVLDDDAETEWQHFLRQSLEIEAKIAELMPTDVFRLLYQPFSEYLDIYMGLEQLVTNGGQGRKLNITVENECRRLHCTLRDLSSLLQALGRLSGHFIGEKFLESFSDAQMLVERLVQTAAYGSKVRMFEVNCTAVNVLRGDFIEVHAQSLAAVKANASWLSQFMIESHTHGEQKEKCNDTLTVLIQTVVPLFEKQSVQIPDKIVQSAAHLFLSVMTTIRPSFLLQMRLVQGLYQDVSQGSLQHLSTEVQLLVYRSLSHFLLLPWPNMVEGDQEWVQRSASHHTFIKQLAARYRQLKDVSSLVGNRAMQDEAKPCVRRTVRVLTDLVESIAVEGVSKSKAICYHSMQDLIQVSLSIFPIYIHQPGVVDDLLGFFLALFEGLRVQMGVPLTEQTIQTFMSIFTREQLTETILSESTAGFKVVEKFLKILQVIVREPGTAFKRFVPDIISISMDQIYSIIAQRPSPDIKPTFYALQHDLLQHNWRYFFKGSVLTALQSQNDEMQHQEQFMAIMQSFGQSFLQPDIAIFKQNLEALENLNSKWKLYHKKIFKELMLFQYLNVLLQVLVCKSHDLLQEEIGITIYNMASVDFDAFYCTFLPQFLGGCEGIDANQKSILGANFKLDKDLPSFTQSVQRFVNDLRYYQLCNSSLPAGSVSLLQHV